jgi:hypothetical protein
MQKTKPVNSEKSVTKCIKMIQNGDKLFYIFKYEGDELKIKGYKYGVYLTPNPKSYNDDIFDSKEFQECIDFAKVSRTQQVVLIYEKEKDAEILTFEQARVLIRIWNDGEIRLARFMLGNDEKSCEFWMYGRLHFGTFYRMKTGD